MGVRMLTYAHLKRFVSWRTVATLAVATALGCIIATVRLPLIHRPAEHAGDQLVNIGRVTAGSVIRHVFTLHNDQDRDVKIANVLTSCGCTVADLPKRTISAHDSLEIPVTVKLPDEDRDFEVYAAVSYSDSSSPTKLMLRFHTVRELPTVLDLGRFGKHEARTAEFAFKPANQLNRVVRLEYDNRVLTIEDNQKGRAAGINSYDLRLSDDPQSGDIDQTVTLIISDGHNTAARSMRVVGHRFFAVEARETQLLLDAPLASVAVGHIYSPYNRPFRVTAFTASNPGLEVETLKSGNDANELVFHVKRARALDAGVTRATLTITGKDALGEEFNLTLPVLALGSIASADRP